jgi:hypothetical protein
LGITTLKNKKLKIIKHMEIKDKIVIANDFSDHPGGRYIKDGQWSGQEFLENLLLPKLEKAILGNYILEIDLDKVYGYPSSFVSGSFGKLSQVKDTELILKHIKLKSDDNPLNAERIIREIKTPNKQ